MRIDYPRQGREGFRRWIPSWKLAVGGLVSLMVAGVALFAAVFAFVYATTSIPDVNEVAKAQTTIVYWNDGKTELARVGDTNRISVPLAEVPEDVQHAVVAAEDRRFFEHWGFDVAGMARAFWRNLTSGSTQGGSTITQQLAKNMFLTDEQSYVRKFKELVLALKLEVQLSKEEILEDYLNVIYYGRGAYGIQTGAEAYFTTDSQDLTLEQGAVLASIINGPGMFNPDSDEGLERLEARYAYVLDGMVQEGWISDEDRTQALEDFPKVAKRSQSQRYAGPEGFLLRSVQDELLTKGFSEEQISAGGLRVVSTFSRQAQDSAEDAVENQAPRTGMKGVRIGLAAVEPLTGEIVAMYGGADYLEDSFNNATQARYQAGSTFKPFGLVAATEQDISLYSLWPGNTGTVVNGYTVNNYANNSYGERVTLLRGTEQSINTVYVSVEAETGVPAVQDATLRAGIPEDTPGLDNQDLTFVLGTASPHTVDIAQAYATFAARGERSAGATTLRRVESADGRRLLVRRNDSTRVMSRNTADIVNFALSSVVRNGTGSPAAGVGRPVAAKTGSTDEYRSAWFAGYVPQLAAAVSFGKSAADGSEASLSGVGGMPAFYGSGYPARIWTAFMRGALEGTDVESFTTPSEFPGGGQLPTATPTPTRTPTPTSTQSPTRSPVAPTRRPSTPATTPEVPPPANGQGEDAAAQ